MSSPATLNRNLALGTIYYAAACAITGIVWRGFSYLASRSARPGQIGRTNSSRSDLLEKGSGNAPSPSATIRAVDAIYSILSKSLLRMVPWSSDTDYAQIILIAFLFLYHILATFVGIQVSEESSYLDAASLRCGILAYADLVLMFLLASRNNLLSFACGIPYVRFNALHRMLGVLIMVFVILHGAAQTASLIHEGKYSKEWNDPAHVLRYGVAAACVMGLMLVLPAFYLIRLKRYETFLFLHVAGAAALLALLVRHRTKISLQAWVWTATAIWAFDRTLRVARVLYLHLFSFHGRVEFHVELVAGAILLRAPTPPHWPIAAGSHIFATCFDRVFLSRPWLMFESHPFSVAYCSDGGGELVLLCKVRGAFTQRLAHVAERGGKISALVEGGYAGDEIDSGFHQNILLAGGTGYGSIQTLFAEAVRRAARGKAGAMQRVHLIWATQHIEQLGWLCDELLASIEQAQTLPNLETVVDIYVTRSKTEDLSAVIAASTLDAHRKSVVERLLAMPARSRSQTSLPSMDSEKIVARNALTIHLARPPLDDLLREACARGGRIIVTACGPSTFNRAAQKAARDASASASEALKGGAVCHFVQASF